MGENKNEEWNMSGDCSRCRRREYCGSKCNARKAFERRELRGAVIKAMANIMYNHEGSDNE